ncbi:MAG: hypothetical protein WD844_12175 [Thermoleophilaceae bacterium]
MSEPAVSVAFFDPANGLHGSARAGVSLLFEGAQSTALPHGPELEREGERWRATVADGFTVELEPISDAVELAGAASTLCRVTGTAAGRDVDGLGTVTETHAPPSWDELDALRGISAIFDGGHALLAVARRPRGAVGHDAERVEAVILEEGAPLAVETAHLSTVYDGEGRQRSAGLELWLPGEDFPRRAFGTVAGGTTLQLEQLRVNASIFSWRMEGRTGAGAYDLVVRDQPPVAA